MKSIPPKVCVTLGDLRKHGTPDEFQKWMGILVKLRDSVKSIEFRDGEKSGTVFCDMLNGRMDEEEALASYGNYPQCNTKRTAGQKLRVVPDVMVHIGSHGDIENWDDGKGCIFVSADTSVSNERLLAEIAKKLYLAGVEFNWDVLYPDDSANIINLPAYPFERNSVWISKRNYQA